METGIAIGGPRDRVKLTASADWDGRVQMPDVDFKDGAIRRYYPGRYRWSADIPGWVWVAESAGRGVRTPRADGYNRKP